MWPKTAVTTVKLRMVGVARCCGRKRYWGCNDVNFVPLGWEMKDPKKEVAMKCSTHNYSSASLDLLTTF